MSAISPLEPLLPGGYVETILVLGSRPPAGLLPTAARCSEDDVHLVLLVPNRRELADRGWLRMAVSKAAGAIRADGIVYASVSRGFRRRMRTELERAGLTIEPPFAHLPSAAAPRYLVQLDGRAWRYAFTRLISARVRGRDLARSLSTLPLGIAALSHLLPTLGLAARRPDSRPLGDWISSLAGEEHPALRAVVRTSGKQPAHSVTVHCFGESPLPWAIAKLAPPERDESRSLLDLAQEAERAGARVPRLLGTTTSNGRSMVVETVVSGSLAADVLARSPGRLTGLIDPVVDWLARWAQATARRKVLDRPFFDAHVLDHAASLRSVLPAEYEDWLRERCETLSGSEASLVAAHNDLTMWNIVLEEDAPPGVLDWETAERLALPMVDFFYALTDAVCATEGYASRLRAFDSCFAAGGSRRSLTSKLQRRVTTATEVSASVAELAFHACWLRHAANDVAAGADASEFVEIVHWLVLNRERVAT